MSLTIDYFANDEDDNEQTQSLIQKARVAVEQASTEGRWQNVFPPTRAQLVSYRVFLFIIWSRDTHSRAMCV